MLQLRQVARPRRHRKDAKMSSGTFILFIVIGGVVGGLAGLIIRLRGVGLIGEIVIGVIGAVIGGWLFGLFGIPTVALIAAFVGAIILIFIIQLIKWDSLFQKSPSLAFDPNAQLPSFGNITRDADVLLSYAATAGIAPLNSDVAILTAEPKPNKKDVLLAYSRVAIQLLPVTAFTLRKFFTNYNQNVRFYVIGGIILAVIVVFFSLFTFISSALSDSIKSEIDLANSKAVMLLTHLASPDGTLPEKPNPFAASTTYSLQDLLTDLQQFAISLRFIDGRAQQLQRLVNLLPVDIKDPLADIRVSPDSVNLLHGKFELETQDPPESNFVRLLQTYQQVRAWAQNLRDAVLFWGGGVAASVLPVLYAILGVCALSLRRMQVAIRDKTFSDSSAKEHMVVAVIAGMMITLFSGLFTTSGVSLLPPLALAFLAGYSSDAFFRVLEGVLGPRTPGPSSSPAGGAPQAGAAGGAPQAGAAGGAPHGG